MHINIITVCYNSEKTIEKTFKSVLNQKSENLRYYVVDGQSTDSTIEIIKKYQVMFSERKISFQYTSEKDSGIYDAMNKGISIVPDGVISFLNADDWLSADFVETISKEILVENAIYIGNINCIDDNNKKFTAKPRFPLSRMKDQMCVFHPGTCVGKKVFEQIGQFNTDYRLSGDYDFFLRAYLAGIEFKYIDKTLANYYLFGQSNKNRKQGLKENLIIRKKNKVRFAYIFYLKEKYISPLIYKLKTRLK